jgi:hypothetical protein
MGLARLNIIVMAGILPFNFGATWEDYQEDWDQIPSFRRYFDQEPVAWSDERKAQVDACGKAQADLCDHLMELSDEDFRIWLDEWDALDEPGREAYNRFAGLT